MSVFMTGCRGYMPKKIKLKYGRESLGLKLPESTFFMGIQEPEDNIDLPDVISELACQLPENSDKLNSIAIVVADKTRLCDYKIFLPIVIKTLVDTGVKKESITFYIAYGTHKRQSDSECLAAYGELYRTHRFVHHECNDMSLFKSFGKTKLGTPIRIRKDIFESDLIITFGALSHHYFAGYGGGRKLLFPGLGFKPDIYANHKLFLDRPNKRLNTGCKPGNFNHNFLAQDLMQIDDTFTQQRIAIHGILNSEGHVCQLVIGKTYDDFLGACSILDSCYKVNNKKQYSIVIASCGGYPKDINFIQSHKAINNAAMFVKAGGTLIILAECIDGIGSDNFLEYFDTSTGSSAGSTNFKSAFDILEKNYKGNGGTALSMMTKTSRIKIFLKTHLDDKICIKLGMTKLNNKLINQMIAENSTDLACIENASLLIQ